MPVQPLFLSPEQMNFLAALETCGEPAPLDLIKTLAPIESRALEDMLARGNDLGWLKWTVGNRLRLGEDFPVEIKQELKKKYKG